MDEEKCTACGVCAQYCPVTIPDPHNRILSFKKAIDIRYTQAIPATYSVHPDYCLFLNQQECKQCTRACQTGAIDFNQRPSSSVYQVGAIILTIGFTGLDPNPIIAYGYKDSANVVTGLEFERISSASGPYGGRISRPSDEKKPHKIGFVQCAGSRTIGKGREYCSTVCCKYAVKDAIVALEHEPDLDISIFFMDMRMQGKGFESFYERAKSSGVKFIRARVSEIRPDRETEDLTLHYVTEDNRLCRETFNLVVLPMGLSPPEGNFGLARAVGIKLNPHGFCSTNLLAPLATSREGIFVAGGFKGPMALPDAVTQASGAAACVAEMLAPVRGTMILAKSFPEERAVEGESLRIGVFICNCGKNIAGVVDVAEVIKYGATLPDVVTCVDNLYSCSEDTQVLIRETVRRDNLNRIVIGACTPRTHEPLFQETAREAGLNRCLVEMVNIRDQCSWVHAQEKEAATKKAKDLIRMAVAKARLIRPLAEPIIDVIPTALIIGGGLAGMTAALSLADQGFHCYLLEKTAQMGGNCNHIHYTLAENNPQAFLAEMITAVFSHKNITVYTAAHIEGISGFVGNFNTVIALGEEKKEELRHGVIILAIGAVAIRPDEYLYGQSDQVLLQHELEEKLADGSFVPTDDDSLVFIQCVGSRDEMRPYCSTICCAMAIKNALKIKELNPATNVYVLYRDMRTAGLDEDYYTQARKQGVVFIRYRRENKPQVTETDNGIRVMVRDQLLDRDIVINARLVALSVAIVPRTDDTLDRILPVPRSADGFYLESHVQLKPVDSYIDGIYICGMALFPKPVDEAIAQAKAAASRAAILLARGHVKAEPIVAACDPEICIGCGLCESFCPYTAIRMTRAGKRKQAQIIVAACKGCGICASYCPARAISVGRFTNEQIFAQIQAFGVTT